jgi:hypothetical protein
MSPIHALRKVGRSRVADIEESFERGEVDNLLNSTVYASD